SIPAPKRGERWWERRSDAPPDEIDRAAALYNIPAELVRAVIWAESAGDAAAISRAGAIGLMQLMPHTAGTMYVEDPVDPAQNIMGGTRYIRWLANQFNGDMLPMRGSRWRRRCGTSRATSGRATCSDFRCSRSASWTGQRRSTAR